MGRDRINFVRVFSFTLTESERSLSRGEVASGRAGIFRKDIFMGVSGPNGGVSYFSRVRGTKSEWAGDLERGDFISVIYKVSQFQINDGLRSGGGMKHASSYFDWLAGRRKIALKEGKFVESPLRPEPVSDVSELVSRVRRQFKYGLALFDAEAIAAHVGALWESWIPHGSENVSSQALLVNAALNSMVGGDYRGFRSTLSKMKVPAVIEKGGSAFPEDAAHVVSLFRNIALAECFYRDAACQESGQARLDRLRASQMLIDGSMDCLGIYKSVYAEPDRDPVLRFTKGFKELVAQGMVDTDERANCAPVGTLVDGFGPTAAAVEHMVVGGKKYAAVVPYVPMGTKLATPWPMPR
jgi:hypothetical protein